MPQQVGVDKMRPLTYEDLRAVESVIEEMNDTADFWESGAYLHVPGESNNLHDILMDKADKIRVYADKIRIFIAPDSTAQTYAEGGVPEILECGWCGAPTRYITERGDLGICIACSVTAK